MDRIHIQVNMIKRYRLFACLCFLLATAASSLYGQDPDSSIHQLKNGYLIVRLPSNKNKIDTLQNMIARAEEGAGKKRLSNLLTEAIEQRDSTRSDYMNAFKQYYNFSKVAFIMDYDSRQKSTARYFGLDEELVSVDVINSEPVYYLHFERTSDSKIDAAVIYDAQQRRIPRPFPNNFARGGISFLFVSIEGKSFADWRVKKMNKQLHKFYNYTRI